MSSWTIYGANGSVKAVVKELELHDEWMAECFLTITVQSATPIDFEVGDYIDYRGERYSINYDPSVLKKARRSTYGEGFTYENIKFVAVQDEVVRCDFNDIVLSDNQMHYTQLPIFPFYCENVDDLLDRIQANLEELYPGGWTIISPDLDKDRQRGMCVGREEDFVDAYNRYIGGGSFTYEKTGIALTADNITCWDALKWVNEQFDLNFVVRGRVIVVGTAGAVIGNRFRYGKGEGLYEIEKISDSEQKIITRLRGYGAETNLPDRYYSERNARPCFYVSELDPSASTPQVISVLIDNNKFNNVFTEIIDEVSGSQKIAIGECEMDGIEFSAGFELVNGGENTTIGTTTNGCTTRMLIGADGSVVISGEEIPTNPQATIDALKAAMVLGSKIIFNAGVNKKYVDSSHITASSTGLPDNMSVNRLMLPGFPSKSLAEWVEDHMDNEKVAAIVAEGFTFSDEVNRPYIDSPNKEMYGIRPSSIYFDGSNDNEDIHPSIEGMTWEGRTVDEVVNATQIDDNGVLAEDATEAEKIFTITIPMAGFTLPDLISDESSVDMKNGMCGARSFKIKSVKKNENGRDWDCICYRTYDDTLKLYFPYYDFQISPHDNFVLTGIELPDSYIEAASEKLFFATVDALRANHAPRYTFQPRIDEIWMQRQDDIAKSSHGAIASLHDTLKSGDLFSFIDEDLGISAQIIIDILTIKENGNNGIPTYEITLREEKVVSALDKRLDKITSVVSGIGGGLSGRQYSGMIALEGSELFLSKIYDDVAQGVIGFLRGAWFGAKQWYIDAAGNANFYNTTVNGILKAWNAIINNVRSTNYTGDGMMDSGWRITNEYEGTNSKATFDYLYIRKKAIFEELEIRKLSHIGGNFCLSGASGRVWKVDYYDENGESLGYDVRIVPWTLGGRIMNLFTKNPTILNKYLGKKKMIQRRLTDAEKLRVATIRVYMFTDDGSTETMANWTVGAQARCQQFNVEKQMEFDGSSWTGTKVGNTYWYRLVSAVGEQKMEDGLNHEWIEFRVDQSKEGTAYEWADAGSDFPSVGDVFVQMGHRTREDQSNVIMLETANEDSPAIKMYAGVNWWTIPESKMVAIMSPDGWKVMSERFEWVTWYGERFRQENRRGAWISIPLDENNHRRCYTNDVVAHNGCYWRCIVAEGTYTTDEPSESSSAWIKEVAAGKAPYVQLSEQLIAIPCEKNGTATAAFSTTVTPTLWVDGLQATITSVTLTGADANVYKSGNNIIVNYAAGASVTNGDYAVKVEGTLGGNHYEATENLGVYAAVRGYDGYEVAATPDLWIWWQAGAQLSYDEIMAMIARGEHLTDLGINVDGRPQDNSLGNSGTQISVSSGGTAVPFRITGVTASPNSVRTTYDNTLGRVWVTYCPPGYQTGYVDITIAFGSVSNYVIRVPFTCNLIGSWREMTFGDVNAAVAEKKWDILDENGNVVSHQTIGEYFRSSSRDSAILTHTVSDQGTAITNTNSRVSTAESNIQTLSSNIQTVDGKFSNYSTTEQTSQEITNKVSAEQQRIDGVLSTSYSTTTQTASAIDTKIADNNGNYYTKSETSTKVEEWVTTPLGKTGIVLDGNNSHIDLYGDKIKFYKSKSGGTGSSNLANIQFDLNKGGYYFNGTFYAENGAGIYLSGTNTSMRAGNDANIYANNDLTLEADGKVKVDGGSRGIELDGDVIVDDALSVQNGLTVANGASITGGLSVTDDVCLLGALVVGNSLTLPASPKGGQIYFCKGVTGTLNITTRSHGIMQADTQSYVQAPNVTKNWGDDSFFLIYTSMINNGEWLLFKCWN